MATTFTVQCFQLKGRTLVPDPPKSSRTGGAAIELAERLAAVKVGVVAFSQEIDVETDTYDEPRVLCRIGRLPEGFCLPSNSQRREGQASRLGPETGS